MQDKRIELFNEIVDKVKQFNETNPQRDNDNINSLLVIGSVQIQGEIITNENGDEIEKPVKEITAIIGKQDDLMNCVIKALFNDERIYEVFKQGTAIVMNEKFNKHIDNLKN